MHLVGCLYYCINDARSHKHQIADPYNKARPVYSPMLVRNVIRGMISVEVDLQRINAILMPFCETVATPMIDRCNFC